jgi:hypothetical protein
MLHKARILVAADLNRRNLIAPDLIAAGHDVSIVDVGPLVVKQLVEDSASAQHERSTLLVLDGLDRSWICVALVDALRAAGCELPVVLIAKRDQNMIAEAKRLSIELLEDWQLFTPALGEVVCRLLS